MSEYLLLSVYRRYLQDQGYTIEQKAAIPDGVVDILAKSHQRTLLAEAKWIRSPGDIYEAVGRCVQNKLALPEGIPVLVLPVGVTTEDTRERILSACYKHGIEIHYIDINKREVFPDYLTTQIYPAFHGLIRVGQMLLEQKLSGPQSNAIRTLLTPLQQIREPPELIDDVARLLKQF
ncbi:MAG: hypothetical protein ACFE89_02895 [Candidatus Hodarchaeota archaeon]